MSSAGGALARQVQELQSGTTTSAALVTAALAAARSRQPDLHAFVRTRAAATQEAAAADRARAAGDDRPLLGVPLAVKDSQAVAGELAPADGTDAVTSVATVDDPWVAELRAAGAIVMG